MSTFEKIEKEFKEAMKARDELGLSVLRLMRSELKNKQIELGKELDEKEVQAVLKGMIKQYLDALSDFSNAGRQDLVERQQAEIDVVRAYLPPALPKEDLEKIVQDALTASGEMQDALTASGEKDFGKAMGAAMKAVDGRADGGDVREIVQRLISR